MDHATPIYVRLAPSAPVVTPLWDATPVAMAHMSHLDRLATALPFCVQVGQRILMLPAPPHALAVAPADFSH